MGLFDRITKSKDLEDIEKELQKEKVLKGQREADKRREQERKRKKERVKKLRRERKIEESGLGGALRAGEKIGKGLFEGSKKAAKGTEKALDVIARLEENPTENDDYIDDIIAERENRLF